MRVESQESRLLCTNDTGARDPSEMFARSEKFGVFNLHEGSARVRGPGTCPGNLRASTAAQAFQGNPGT